MLRRDEDMAEVKVCPRSNKGQIKESSHIPKHKHGHTSLSFTLPRIRSVQKGLKL